MNYQFIKEGRHGMPTGADDDTSPVKKENTQLSSDAAQQKVTDPGNSEAPSTYMIPRQTQKNSFDKHEANTKPEEQPVDASIKKEYASYEIVPVDASQLLAYFTENKFTVQKATDYIRIEATQPSSTQIPETGEFYKKIYSELKQTSNSRPSSASESEQYWFEGKRIILI